MADMNCDTNLMLVVDMDEVLADFIGGAIAAANIPIERSAFTSWDMPAIMGISLEAFWASQEALPNFWLDLQPYPGIAAWMDALRSISTHVIICSKPSPHRHCASHKLLWLERHLGTWARDACVLTQHKHLLARSNRILIDDAPHNVQAWRNAGGHAVVFPQPHNGADPRLTIQQKQDLVLAQTRVCATHIITGTTHSTAV